MRQRFEAEPALNLAPIEKVLIPLRSRDELPPILAGLQWIWMNATLKAQVLGLVEGKVLANKLATGRMGMDLWQILVLGVVRLGLDANYDRLEHIANYDTLLRQILGVAQTPWGEGAKVFNHQTLRDNVALVDEALLKQINALVAAAGREVFAKKGGAPAQPLALKVDTYVLETDVHFPTDLNLLWDAGRKCVDLVQKYRQVYDLPGWRKAKDWRRRLKGLERISSKAAFGRGPDKAERVQAAVGPYLVAGRELSAKVSQSLLTLCAQPILEAQWEALAYFQGMLDKHLDLVERRLLRQERIPASEKVYSLFEPHTEWIAKGKLRPSVELGHRLLVATDQHGLIQDYDVPVAQTDVDQSVPVADRVLGRYGPGSIASISFDKGFTRAQDRELLRLYIPEVVMPKRGRKNATEEAQESSRKFMALRRQHSAVESDIAALEHHGLDRCLDVGWEAYQRYVGYGVLAFNLHQIGRELLARRRAGGSVRALPRAA
jgi:hypothetical protein